MEKQVSYPDSFTFRHPGSFFLLGAIPTIAVLAGIILDIIIGSITGGDLTALPHSAAGRFEQIHSTPWLGMYNLDLLNALNQLLMIPLYLVLFILHRDQQPAFSALAVLVFITSTILMLSANAALPMYDMSQKYFSAEQPADRALFAAAGEALLPRGEHGSPGAFPGFFLSGIAGLIISFVMLRGKILSKVTGWLGILGNILISLYLMIVSFIPQVKQMATVFAMPGGLLLLAWLILITRFLLKQFRTQS